ncbi:hypothetical protein ABH935_003407 [Catenulispora sp. GAS73]|uniref:hypothetical protein n=1 Tax=Catenulispora sp. GAS73 TaxID=3156269 RepID=UPI003513A85F
MPLRDIARRSIQVSSGRALSIATLSRLLNAMSMPGWDTVRTFLLSIGVSEHEVQTVWLPAWTRLADAVRPLDDQAGTEAGHVVAIATTPCHLCGVIAPDSMMHTIWHAGIQAREELLLEQVARLTAERDAALRVRAARRPAAEQEPGAVPRLRIVSE